MVIADARALSEKFRSFRPLFVDTMIAAGLMLFSYTSNPSVNGRVEPVFFAPPLTSLPGGGVVYALWCIAAFALLSLARTRTQWVCWGLPLLLFIHLLLFPITTSSTVVTCYAVLILSRFAVPQWRKPALVAALLGTAAAMLFRSDLIISQEWTLGAAATVAVWLVLGFFWQWGSRMRVRDLELQGLRDRARLAAISERTRIAREMHDIVAHSLTAIIVQADGGRYAGRKDPETAVSTLETIAASARESLAQMRGLLSVLRDGDEDDSERQSAPGIDAIPQLIKEAEANGLAVRFRVDGTPYPLDPTRALTVYRIVQECLTNAIRHAGTGEADVEITWAAKEIVIRVHNDVAGPQVRAWRGGSGRGLTGIRERAQLHGGRIEIDNQDGFTVTARIPRR